MSRTSIDDLLSFEEERPPRPERREGGRLRTVLGLLGVTVAATVVLVAGLRAVGLQVSLLVLVAAVLTLLLMRRIVAVLAPPPKSRRLADASRGGEEDGMYNWTARDALRTAVNGWETPLDWSRNRPERFTKIDPAPPRRAGRRAVTPEARRDPRVGPGPGAGPAGRPAVDVPADPTPPHPLAARPRGDRRRTGEDLMNDAGRKMPPTEVGHLARTVLDAVGQVVVGKRDALELVLAGILAGGHVLLEDLPGLGKTLTARSFAQALGLDFRRLQFTPDLLPADVTGSFLYDQRSGEFAFRAGPVFTNLLLADEINRTPPKTQSALLEAMQEKQVSVEGVTYRLDEPFHVLATANPVEYEGTYPLPEAQLDRFLLRVSFGYPEQEEEWEVLRRRMARRREEAEIKPVVDAGTLRAMQAALEDVTVEDSVGRYIVALTAATREHPSVLVGASPRGSLALLLLARVRAVFSGRDYVVPEDVKDVAAPALAHRITLRPEMWLRRVDPAFVVGEVLDGTPAPASGALPSYAAARQGH